MFGKCLVDCVVIDTSIAGTFYNKCACPMSPPVDCHPIAAQGLKVYLKVWGCRGVSRPAPGGNHLPLYPLYRLEGLCATAGGHAVHFQGDTAKRRTPEVDTYVHSGGLKVSKDLLVRGQPMIH